MSLNLRSQSDPALQSQVKRARLICLATLPLMFENQDFRELVEDKISKRQGLKTSEGNLEELVKHDNREFYRLIKEMIREEDAYNLRHHFERYFAISGFVRNLLNEIIKLQTQGGE